MKRSTSSSRLRHALAWATGLALLLALPIAAVLENGRDKVQLRKVVDGYVVDLTFPVAPRRAADNPVFVKLSTANGKPASGATVSVAATPQTGDMSHQGGESGAGAHGGGETKSHDSGGATDMGGSDDHTDMDMGGSDDHTDMDMGGSDDHTDMDMGGSDGHMDMSSEHERSAKPAAGADGAKDHQVPHKKNVLASPGTVLRPDRTLGVHKGLIPIRAGDTSKMDVNFALAGTTHAASFEVDIARQRPRALVFGGFAAANLLVLIAAFLVRRREKAARPRSFA